ncbi:MAG TPA: PHP domain-containing protein, partial [Dehalococcoidia bacterium]|nr:PHP domain-containing protein [Dehalococcoidia bacterium]
MEADGVEEREQAEHAPWLIDMHVHSTLGSADSNLTPDHLVRRARVLGLAGAALTEHYRVWPDEEVARAQAPDLALLPAAEWSTDLGHILCFGIERHVSGMSRAEDVREYVLERRGFMVAAHPFRYAFTTQERHAYLGTRGRMTAEQAAEAPVFRLVDEIEVCNGGCTDEENLFALQVAHLLGKRG